VELFGEIDYSGSQKVHLKTGTTQLVVQSNSFEGSVVIVPERLVNNMNFKICLGQKNTPFIRMQNVKAYFDQDTTWYALSLLNSRGDSIQNLADLKDIELYLRKKGIQQFEYNGTPYFLVFNLAEYPVNKRFGLIEQLSNMKKVEHVGLWYSGCMGVGSKGILSGEIIVEKKFPEYHHNLHDYNDLFNRYKVSADYDYSYNYIKLKYLGQVNSNFIQVVNKIAESGQFLYTMPATYFPVPISYGKGTGN
jgi:hypothetical protein